MRDTKLNRLRAVVAAEAVLFFLGSFLANFLTGFINGASIAYFLAALIATSLFVAIKWVLLRPERLAALASLKLADTFAASAEAYGLNAIYNMQKREDQDQRNRDTQAAIQTSRWMRLAANSGASYLSTRFNRHWDDVRSKLDDGAPFKVILLDPFGPERALRNKLNAEPEPLDSKIPLQDILRASERYPGMEVRFAQVGMTCSVFITDELAFYDPYHLALTDGRITNRFLCLRTFKMKPAQGLGNYEVFVRHFDSLWQNAIPLTEWKAEHEEELPE